MNLKIAASLRCSLCVWLALAAVGLSRVDCLCADPEAFIGRASCASATCHGGIGGRGPAWNSSLRTWEATDLPHAGAGVVLLGEQSRKMVDALVGAASDETAVRSVLLERCVSCHAPSLSPSPLTNSASEVSWQRQLGEGVSCEACHGAANQWLDSHTLVVTESALASTWLGMTPTQPWLDRTDNCLRCHLGSRLSGAPVRDVNHDLIAAGHPTLQFDMSTLHARLPAHWSVEPTRTVPFALHQPAPENGSGHSKLTEVYEFPTPHEHHLSRLRTLSAAANLSLERLAASQHGLAPHPEFAEYDCLACHQGLGARGVDIDPSHHGLIWNPMLTQNTLLGEVVLLAKYKELSTSDRLMESSLASLATAAEDRILGAQLAPIGALQALQAAADIEITKDMKVNSEMAANWLGINRLMLWNLSSTDSSNDLTASLAGSISKEDAVELGRHLEAFAVGLRQFQRTVGGSRAINESPARSMGLDRQIESERMAIETTNRLEFLRESYRRRLMEAIPAPSNLRLNGTSP